MAGLLALLPGLAAADALTEEGRALLGAGRGKAAYALLEPQESSRAGEVDYDYLLGLAALDVGQNTRAVFALERVLALDPEHVRARAAIARAYLALGEAETARREFETVQRQGAPADISLSLDRYIAAARRHDDPSRSAVNGYLEAVVGYDTNVNAGPNKSAVVIPGISASPVTLTGDGRAGKDYFGQLGAGIDARVPLAPGVALLGGLSGAQRLNADKDQFDLGNVDANAGVVVSAGRNVYTLMGQFGQFTLDRDNFRSASGVTGQWQHNLDARNQFSAFAQYSRLHYNTQGVRDADRRVGGAGYAHLWRDGAVAFGSVYYVGEKPDASGVDFLGFDGFGLRLGSRLDLGARTVVFGSVAYEQRRYDAVDPSFLRTRRDEQYVALFGATYAFAKDWTVTPQLSLTRNQSNTELNDYHREVASLAIRREF